MVLRKRPQEKLRWVIAAKSAYPTRSVINNIGTNHLRYHGSMLISVDIPVIIIAEGRKEDWNLHRWRKWKEISVFERENKVYGVEKVTDFELNQLKF